MPRVNNNKVSIGCPPPREGWKSFQFNLKAFKDLSTTWDHYVETPEFSCNGHDWKLRIYVGGTDDSTGPATEGYVSIYLYHLSEGSTTASFEIKIIDKFGKQKNAYEESSHRFEGKGDNDGCPNFIKRSDILDESQNILDSDGMLAVVVSMKEDLFVPSNQFQKIVLQDMFLDEDTADVCFEVCCPEAKEGKKEAKASELFHAHHLILKQCAPMLADLFDLEDSNGKVVTATITDVKPGVFRHLLHYVYGGSVPEEELKTHAKDIIDAADKYSIISLKLEAEAACVTAITMQSAMDNLLYADAKNCPLLKEAVMNFLAANHYEAAEKISFTDFPGHLVKDLLIAFGGSSKNDASGAATDELSTLCVSVLRRKLDEMGSSVDGSREAMIESIKNSS